MKWSEWLDRYEADHQHPINHLTHIIGIPLILSSLIWFFFDWRTALVLFVVGWVFQLVGHLIEGNKPSFFSNAIFLLIGPLFYARKLIRWVKKSFG